MLIKRNIIYERETDINQGHKNMHVNSIGIFTNPNNDGALDAAEAIRLAAAVRGISCYIDKSLLDIEQFQGLDTTETNTPNLMVAMGGDGTILRAANYAADKGVPLLGINFGRIGFLSEINVDSFSYALDAIREDRFTMDKCMMLACSINGGEPIHCLNEAVLYRKNFSGVVSINVNINGSDAGTVSCDGLIISTPTGATGYSISAGGPIIAPGLDADIITPICPHTLSFRPIIAPPDSKVRLSLNQEGFLAMDGINTERIMPSDVIDITRSNRSVSFIRLGDRNLFQLIRNKLS